MVIMVEFSYFIFFSITSEIHHIYGKESSIWISLFLTEIFSHCLCDFVYVYMGFLIFPAQCQFYFFSNCAKIRVGGSVKLKIKFLSPYCHNTPSCHGKQLCNIIIDLLVQLNKFIFQKSLMNSQKTDRLIPKFGKNLDVNNDSEGRGYASQSN